MNDPAYPANACHVKTHQSERERRWKMGVQQYVMASAQSERGAFDETIYAEGGITLRDGSDTEEEVDVSYECGAALADDAGVDNEGGMVEVLKSAPVGDRGEGSGQGEWEPRHQSTADVSRCGPNHLKPLRISLLQALDQLIETPQVFVDLKEGLQRRGIPTLRLRTSTGLSW
ncbi:hypothetical protein BDZ89DRAFT_1232029 [Hymenopellis radicata]|nr:hypothetical protein BDZ89DRAFT_1232029 [Hymenopellis radicata]